ncbi:MAG: Ig-like domain-containing protein [Caldilineaceae bacterium]|nr:Ig-like domain-containing protein [Caldilineaceae bacterium]
MAGGTRRLHLIVSMLVILSLLLSSCTGAVTDLPPTPTAVAALEGDPQATFAAAPPETTPTLIPLYTPAAPLVLDLPRFALRPRADLSPAPPPTNTPTTAPTPTVEPPTATPTQEPPATPTAEPTATPTDEPTPTVELSPTPTEASPVIEITPEAEVTPSADLALASPGIIIPAVEAPPVADPDTDAVTDAEAEPPVVVTGIAISPEEALRNQIAGAIADRRDETEIPSDPLTPTLEITPTAEIAPSSELTLTLEMTLTGEIAMTVEMTSTAGVTPAVEAMPTVAPTMVIAPTPTAMPTPTETPAPTATLEPVVEEPASTEVIFSIEIRPKATGQADGSETPIPAADAADGQGSVGADADLATTQTNTALLVARAVNAKRAELAILQPLAQTQPGDALPPVLIASEPVDGESWAGGSVSFRFDRPLDPDSAAGLIVDPPLEGEIRVDGDQLIFMPAATPGPGVRYHLSLDDRVRNADGTPLGGLLQITLVGALPLAVTNTQPSDGSDEILPDTPVVVIFNKPVVPLTGIDAQDDLPVPLTIEPAVIGEGRWLNTSVYTFVPAQGWAGATQYTVIVDGVTAQDGSALDGPLSFRFTTALPVVVDAAPLGEAVVPQPAISILFNQRMDRASSESAFSLRPVRPNGELGDPVAGSFAWNALGDSLIFTPTAQLDFGSRYRISVGSAALASSQQGNLRAPYSADFTVVTVPQIKNTLPANGAIGVSPDSGIVIYFSGQISSTTVLANISIAPPITATTVYSYFSPWSNELNLNWLMQPRTVYTVTLGAAIADDYGNTLGDPYAFSFTTGDFPPVVQLSLPQFTHFSAYTGTLVPILYRNVEQLDVSLYRLPVDEFLRLAGPNNWEIWRRYQVPDEAQNLIWQQNYETSNVRNETFRQPVALVDENDDPLAPGIYLLQVALPPSRDPYADTHARSVIVISHDNLVLKKSYQGESLTWQTDLITGEPVADAPVRFYEENTLVGEAVGDEDGLAAAVLTMDETQPWYPLIAISGELGDEHFAVASTNWQDGISPWNFDLQTSYSVDRLRTAFYTDRPIYRPGQTIYWKGIIRTIEDDSYGLPPQDLPVHIIVRDVMGSVLVDRRYSLNENGTLNGEITLADTAPTGYYNLEARIGPEDRSMYSSAGFQVAEYRVPEFEISVESDKPEVVQGDTIRITLRAAYFSGGPLADAPVEWRLLAEPYFFSWPDQPRGRNYSFEPADLDHESVNPYGGFFYGLIQEGRGVTDAQGNFVLELPADLGEALRQGGSARSQNWSFDITVQSPSNQFVSGRVTVPVHRSNLYIGISPQEYLGRAGEAMTFDLVTVGINSPAKPDTDLTVVIYDYRWNSVYEQSSNGSYRWETSVEKTPVYTVSVTSDSEGMAQFEWTPEEGGNYFVTVSGADQHGNPASSGVFVWVQAAQDDFISWPRANNDRLELVADRDLYEPGDTAQVLVPSPFTGAVYALVTLERGGIIERSVRILESNSETLAIPILAEHIPNIYVSVVLVKGIDETNPVPSLRVGYVQLAVDAAEKELSIHVEPSVAQARPGESVEYTLTVSDNRGDPVADAELSVALIDKAVLSLSASVDQRLIDRFYYLQPLGVNMGATLIINQDRLSQQLSEGGKGGGGGGNGGDLTLRQNFADVAYWRADAETDANGVVTFSVTLPDNLTTWRLIARAVSDETLVGDAASDLVSTKEVQIRPILPRFFTAGDRARIGAVIQNNSEVDLDGAVFTVEVEGARWQGSGTGAEISRTMAIAAGGMAEENWILTVDEAASSVIITYAINTQYPISNTPFAPRHSQLSDAVRLTLPVHRYETPETVGTAGVVPVEGRLEAIRLPANATDNGELRVRVEPSLAAGMVEGLTYLEHFPYECVEQTVSRFLPNLFTAQALTQTGIDRADLTDNLDAQVEIGLQRLLNRQNPDGGWGWWPGMESNRFITAYVLWGIWHAQQSGYPVSDSSIAIALAFLDGRWQAPSAVTRSWELNEMAFIHFVLAEMGEGDPGRISTLYDVRERLDIYGQAFLAMAMADVAAANRGEDARIQSLLDNIAGRAVLSATGAHWQEESLDWWTMNTDTRTTAIVLATFTRLRPADPLLPNVVRWLMTARQDGRWASTQETVWSIIGLTEWMAATGELEADYTWQVQLNRNLLGEETVTPETVADPVDLRVAIVDLLRNEANALRFSRDGDAGNLYYTAHLRYFLDATAIPARDRGLVVSRSFAAAGGAQAGHAINSAAVGDVISVTVTLQAPADIHFLLLEAPIPAGTEPIDSSLATESQFYGAPEFGMSERSGWDWWRGWVPSHTDIRDEKVALFADYLPAGTYEYTFLVRASLPGEYRVLPVHAEAMYFPDVWGRSSGGLFTVTE